MANISRTPPAVPSDRTWDKDKHHRDFRFSQRVLLVDPSGQILPGIYASPGVRGQKPDGSYLGCDLIYLSPHSGFPMHTHEGDHILYIVEGRGFVHINGKDIRVFKDQVIHIPAEYPHRVWTADSYLTITATGHPHKEIDSKDRMSLV